MSNQALSPVVPFSMAIRERVFCVHRPIRCLDRLFTHDALGCASLHCDCIDSARVCTGTVTWRDRLRRRSSSSRWWRGSLTLGVPSRVAVGPITTTIVVSAPIAPVATVVLAVSLPWPMLTASTLVATSIVAAPFPMPFALSLSCLRAILLPVIK